jgi:N-acyl-D-amino-acid deacylase
MRIALLLGLLVSSCVAPLHADDAEHQTKRKDAVQRGLKVITRGAQAYPEHRKCFSCHHQALPMLSLAMAQQAKYKVEKDVVKSQFEFTQAFFTQRKDSLVRGERIGGAAATIVYGLWTYEIAKAKPDEVTDAMVANLLKLQEGDGHWQPPSHRPPLEESAVSCTVLAGYALQTYGRDDHEEAGKAAFEKAGKWLADAKLESTEDHVFALLWNVCFQPDEKRAQAIAKKLLALQREDGGWGQTPEMESDAYATGQVVFALTLPQTTESAAEYTKGIDYLLKTQEADGSWHVKSRSKPVQKYFDNGDPHGTDQFISMAATSWAITALSMKDAVYAGPHSP